MSKSQNNPTLRWGKYSGLLLTDVIIKDPRYIKWLVDNKGLIVPKALQPSLNHELNKRERSYEKFDQYCRL